MEEKTEATVIRLRRYRCLRAHGVSVIVNLRKRNTKKRVHKSAPEIEYVRIPVANEMRQSAASDALPGAMRRAGQIARSTCTVAVQGHDVDVLRARQHEPRLVAGHSVDEQRPFGFDPADRHKRQAAFLAKFFADAQR